MQTRDQAIRDLNEVSETLDAILSLPAISEAIYYERDAEVVAVYEYIRQRRLDAGVNIAAEFDSSFLAGLIRTYKSIDSLEPSVDADATSGRTGTGERSSPASSSAHDLYTPSFITEAGFQTSDPGTELKGNGQLTLAKNQHAALSNEYVVVESATQKTKATGKKRKAAASAKKASKKMKREDEPVEPVVDVSIIKASPTTLASKLFSVLMFYAIPFPSMASLHQLVATKARPDIMHALVQEMVFCFVAAHSPQAQIRNRLSFNVPNRDAAKVDVPPGLLEADYDSKVQWVARQIKASQNQTERLNILESYYHDFIKVEAHTQDRGKATRPLSKHAVAKDFALQIGIRGISDTNVTKYEYLWAMLSHLRAAGIQSLVLYRNGTMNTLLRNEIFRPADSRLRVSEVEEWGTLVEEIATHLQVSCTIDVEMTWPAYRWRFLAEKIQFEGDCINEFLANATPKATHLDAYGFKGYSDLNRSWALMIPSVGPARPLAITAIEEKSYLGIMPGKIRFGGVCSPSAIVGPGGLWLDLEGEEACLAKIPETTSIDQCNVNVAWEYTEDEMVLGSMGVRVLVFASRKIEIFQEVWRLRW